MQISLRLHKPNSTIFQFYVAFRLTVVQHLSDKISASERKYIRTHWKFFDSVKLKIGGNKFHSFFVRKAQDYFCSLLINPAANVYMWSLVK